MFHVKHSYVESRPPNATCTPPPSCAPCASCARASSCACPRRSIRSRSHRASPPARACSSAPLSPFPRCWRSVPFSSSCLSPAPPLSPPAPPQPPPPQPPRSLAAPSLRLPTPAPPTARVSPGQATNVNARLHSLHNAKRHGRGSGPCLFEEAEGYCPRGGFFRRVWR